MTPKEKYHQRKAEGRCTECGLSLPEGHTTLMCRFCRIKMTARQNAYRRRVILAEIRRERTGAV